MTTTDNDAQPVPQMLGYHEFGDPAGAPIVFLHGANQTGSSWGDIADLLPGARSVCFDLPGTGRSNKTPFTTIEAAADAVAQTLNTLLPERRAPLVGVSLGAYTGLQLMLRHADQVQCAILSGFQVGPIPGGWWLIPFGDVLSPFMTGIAFREKTARSLGIPETSSAWPGPVTPCSAKTFRRINREAVRFDARDALPTIKRPLLALAGEREAKPILDSLNEIRAKVPGAQAVMTVGGHAWPAQHPNLFARILQDWIANEIVSADIELQLSKAREHSLGQEPVLVS